MAKPIVILDTDFSTDPGDAFTLVGALQLQKLDWIDLRAVIVSSSNIRAPGAVSAYMQAFGLSRPVGALQGLFRDPPVEGNGDWVTHVYNNFPRTLGLASTVTDARTLYVDQLSAAADNSVTIVAIGGATSLDILLSAQPALVASKVKELVWMCGDYPSINEEFNIGFDTAAAARVMANWPTVITYIGITECLGIRTGNNYRLDLPVADIVRKTMEVFDANMLSFYGNVAYDEMALLWSVFRRSAFEEIRGSNAYSVGSGSGGNVFTANPAGKDAYVMRRWTDAQYATFANALTAGPRNAALATWPRAQGYVNFA